MSPKHDLQKLAAQTEYPVGCVHFQSLVIQGLTHQDNVGHCSSSKHCKCKQVEDRSLDASVSVLLEVEHHVVYDQDHEDE